MASLPSFSVDADNWELNFFWPGRHVKGVTVTFSLNRDGEPDVDAVDVIDADKQTLEITKLSPQMIQWIDKQFAEASQSDWIYWTEQQAEYDDATAEDHAIEWGSDK